MLSKFSLDVHFRNYKFFLWILGSHLCYSRACGAIGGPKSPRGRNWFWGVGPEKKRKPGTLFCDMVGFPGHTLDAMIIWMEDTERQSSISRHCMACTTPPFFFEESTVGDCRPELLVDKVANSTDYIRSSSTTQQIQPKRKRKNTTHKIHEQRLKHASVNERALIHHENRNRATCLPAPLGPKCYPSPLVAASFCCRFCCRPQKSPRPTTMGGSLEGASQPQRHKTPISLQVSGSTFPSTSGSPPTAI